MVSESKSRLIFVKKCSKKELVWSSASITFFKWTFKEAQQSHNYVSGHPATCIKVMLTLSNIFVSSIEQVMECSESFIFHIVCYKNEIG